jgi:hypothetical protein
MYECRMKREPEASAALSNGFRQRFGFQGAFLSQGREQGYESGTLVACSDGRLCEGPYDNIQLMSKSFGGWGKNVKQDGGCVKSVGRFIFRAGGDTLSE